jgi:hypothetical protein
MSTYRSCKRTSTGPIRVKTANLDARQGSTIVIRISLKEAPAMSLIDGHSAFLNYVFTVTSTVPLTRIGPVEVLCALTGHKDNALPMELGLTSLLQMQRQRGNVTKKFRDMENHAH